MKQFLALCLCFVLCLSLLSGCKDTGDSYTPTGDGLSWEDDSGDNTPEDPQSQQELTLTYYPDRSMNPFEATDFTNRALLSLIYQGLFAVDRD